MLSLLGCELVLVAVAEQLGTEHVFTNAEQLSLRGESKSCSALFAFESHLNVLANLVLYLEKVLAHLILAVVEQDGSHQAFVLVMINPIGESVEGQVPT